MILNVEHHDIVIFNFIYLNAKVSKLYLFLAIYQISFYTNNLRERGAIIVVTNTLRQVVWNVVKTQAHFKTLR